MNGSVIVWDLETVPDLRGFAAANDLWVVDALGAPHVGERTEKQLISAFVGKIAANKLTRAWQCHYVPERISTVDCRENMSRPCIERSPLFGSPIVALVYPCDAAAAAADMVQHRFGNFEPHSQALQSRGERSAQIMHTPWSHRRGACDRSRGGVGAGLQY
jgi:hypothetical protein